MTPRSAPRCHGWRGSGSHTADADAGQPRPHDTEIWTKSKAEYHGDMVDFPEMMTWPKPVQEPHPPILIGGGFPQAAHLAQLGAHQPVNGTLSRFQIEPPIEPGASPFSLSVAARRISPQIFGHLPDTTGAP